MSLRDATERDGIDVEPQPLPPIGSMLMTRALQLATDYLGVEEDPPGSNRGVDVDRFVAGPVGRFSYLVPQPGKRGIPWCARFAASMIESAARELSMIDPLRGAGDLASAYKWLRWAKAAGKRRNDPKPGYVGLLLHEDNSGHVVMVTHVEGEYVRTIEGNASNGVRCRLRVIAGFSAWVDPVAG